MIRCTRRDRYRTGGNSLRVLKRDGFKCVECGMTEEEHFKKWKKGLIIHHIDGKGESVSHKLKNNSIDNLETLCCKCHGIKETKKIMLDIKNVTESNKWYRYNFFIKVADKKKFEAICKSKNKRMSECTRDLISRYINREYAKL
jgi:hypothetical protein